MRFNILILFIFFWFFRGFILEYFLGSSPDSVASSDPLLIKVLIELPIILMFFLSLHKLKLNYENLKLFIPVFLFVLWALFSSYYNNISFLNGILYSRYIIYSLMLYYIGLTLNIDSNKMKILFNLFSFFIFFQVLISIFNIVVYGPFENRIGTMIHMSGELGTIAPLTFLCFYISFYNNISKKLIILIIALSLLVIGISVSKKAIFFIFPIFFILFNFLLNKINNSKSIDLYKSILKNVLLLAIISPILIFYITSVISEFNNYSNDIDISKIFAFAREYTFGENADGTRGRMSTNIKAFYTLFNFNDKTFFGYGPMILYDESVRGYGSGFTILNILYGIVGWSRDFISLGFPSVIFVLSYFYILYKKNKKLLFFKKNMPLSLKFIVMSNYLLFFVFLFDYFFYSAVTFVSGFPLFLITLLLGLSINYFKIYHASSSYN